MPDFRGGPYFDIGLVGVGNYPSAYAFFYQFGVASKTPVPGWSVQLLYPSFVDPNGSWRLMERANIIQGWHSYWKSNYRWGGELYKGVSAKANANDKTLPGRYSTTDILRNRNSAGEDRSPVVFRTINLQTS